MADDDCATEQEMLSEQAAFELCQVVTWHLMIEVGVVEDETVDQRPDI